MRGSPALLYRRHELIFALALTGLMFTAPGLSLKSSRASRFSDARFLRGGECPRALRHVCMCGGKKQPTTVLFCDFLLFVCLFFSCCDARSQTHAFHFFFFFPGSSFFVRPSFLTQKRIEKNGQIESRRSYFLF